MNSKKTRHVKTCECGAEFMTSAKFGNETICDACYKAHQEEFMEWLRQLSHKEKLKLLVKLSEIVADMGIKQDDDQTTGKSESIDPEQASHDDQDTIDSTFAQLMEDIDL